MLKDEMQFMEEESHLQKSEKILLVQANHMLQEKVLDLSEGPQGNSMLRM
jgi:hypothetical protein